ncbi:hypothetical protein I7I50_05324 [Histoplasma capsulatum G186AR]|uniref:Uncharacterized protein n=1 Tax=Ajellomyces capsulatus TaxID=5037 RepID=A0A8H7Z6L3_AJECA|nr:hypothetical protein I7I52_03585 [Histoplasma capsulatum]QSS76008.1 hypothetical protein I7I50_05324 [Histoplasma capsulatum G186AR]
METNIRPLSIYYIFKYTFDKSDNFLCSIHYCKTSVHSRLSPNASFSLSCLPKWFEFTTTLGGAVIAMDSTLSPTHLSNAPCVRM